MYAILQLPSHPLFQGIIHSSQLLRFKIIPPFSSSHLLSRLGRL